MQSQNQVSPSVMEAQSQKQILQTPQHSKPGLFEMIVISIVSVMALICFPITACFAVKVVREYQRAVIFRMGRIKQGGARGPGTFFVLPCVDDYTCIDIRTVTYDIPAQRVLTRDSLTVVVDAVIYYRVFDPVMAVTCVGNYIQATRLLASTTLRTTLGVKTLAEILADRDTISQEMQTVLDEATDPWGMKVERVELKEIRLPQELQRAMAAEAEAQREANAKIIAADGEFKASQALRKASDAMTGSPGALQLRYLQTLNTIAAEKKSTIWFPLPIEFLKAFSK